MLFDYYTIAIVGLLAAISPGPDFFVVAKYALTQRRSHALLATIGVGMGVLVHSIYCVLGLALVISQSIVLFNVIKYLGASYLIYLGLKSLFSGKRDNLIVKTGQSDTSLIKAFIDGLLTNVLNPKCMLFMLSTFTLVVKPDTHSWVQASYGLELALIATLWFAFLSYGFTHQRIQLLISKAQRMVSKVIGGCLLALGVLLMFEERS